MAFKDEKNWQNNLLWTHLFFKETTIFAEDISEVVWNHPVNVIVYAFPLSIWLVPGFAFPLVMYQVMDLAFMLRLC